MELTQTLPQPQSWLRRRSWFDWAYAVALLIGAGVALQLYGGYMDGYEKAILAGAALSLGGLGWHWKPMRVLMIVLVAVSLWSISLYQGDLARADKVFFLKYMISSQTAIMWMCLSTRCPAWRTGPACWRVPTASCGPAAASCGARPRWA